MTECRKGLILMLTMSVLCGRLAESIFIVAEDCIQERCYVLVGSDETKGISFTRAGTACSNTNNMEFASVPNNNTQRLVEGLIGQLSESSFSVLIVGEKSRQVEYIDGTLATEFPNSEHDESTTSHGCAWLRLEDKGGTRLSAEECTEVNSDAKPLCEIEGACNGTGLYYKGKCYVYESNRKRTDWYSAQTHCHTTYGGDLVHTNIMDTTFWRKLYDAGVRQVWVGLLRYPWRWKDSSTPIQYFHWASGFPDDSIPSGSVIYMTPDGTWKNAPWNYKSKYFLCRYDIATTEATTGASSTTTEATNTVSSSSKTSNDMTTSDAETNGRMTSTTSRTSDTTTVDNQMRTSDTDLSVGPISRPT